MLKQFQTNPLNFLPEAFQQQVEGTEREERSQVINPPLNAIKKPPLREADLCEDKSENPTEVGSVNQNLKTV